MIHIPNDEAARLARSNNPVVTRLLEQHSNYQAMSRAVDAAIAADAALSKESPEASEAAIRAEVKERLATGEPVGDLPERLAQQRARVYGTNAAREMLNSIAVSSAHSRAVDVETAVPAMLADLNALIVRTVEEARELWDSVGRLSAEEVAASTDTTTGQAWRQRLNLEQDYTDQRAAQLALTRFAAPSLVAETNRDGTRGEVLFIRNPVDVFEDLALTQRYGVERDTSGGLVRTLRRPWPDSDAPAAEWLAWFATNPDAEPWVPTPMQADDARAAQALARRAVSTDGATTSLI